MPNDFRDLTGSEFERADMSGTRFTTVLLNGAMIRNSDFHQVVMRGVEIVDTTIDGEIQNLVINGVDVAPLVEAELDRRYPDRPKFRPTTADGFREAWDLNERLWAADRRPRPHARPGAAARVGGRRVVVHPDPAPPGVRQRVLGGPVHPRRSPARGIRCRCPGTR